VTLTIAIDAMGGDFGPEVTVPATLSAMARHRDIRVSLVGKPDAIEAQLRADTRATHVGVKTRMDITAASETVAMDEPPAQALRSKKDSSMRVAINLVKEGRADACVSAGNTGALMATARFVLKTLPGIDRPAIATAVPSMHPSGKVHLLDLGANVDSPAELLFQFAVMGSIMVSSVEHISEPSVGLLNVGVEDIKGNDTIKRAAELMRASNLNFQGFIEGDAIYTGNCDVIVCDGFVGNVAIKTSEGLAQMISKLMREEFNRGPLAKLAGLFSLPVLNALKRRVDHRRYNGASLIGLNGTVIKSHGSADQLAFEHAIDEAVAEASNHVPERIERELSPMMFRGNVA
jgi:glycerol-3-phosphate acyltransferase PlsX